MGLRAEKNIFLYDKNKIFVITDYDFNKLDSLWQKQIWLNNYNVTWDRKLITMYIEFKIILMASTVASVL